MNTGVCPFPAGWIFIPFDLQQPAESPSPTRQQLSSGQGHRWDSGDWDVRGTLPAARRAPRTGGQRESSEARRGTAGSAGGRAERCSHTPGGRGAPAAGGQPVPGGGAVTPEAARGGAQPARRLGRLALSPP